MTTLRTVCVYCGSSPGVDPQYAACAEEFGKLIAISQVQLVYGAGGGGLMGLLARSTLKHGGYVTGIVPDFLTHLEPMIEGAQELIVVPDMHTRKRLMFEHSDAFFVRCGDAPAGW